MVSLHDLGWCACLDLAGHTCMYEGVYIYIYISCVRPEGGGTASRKGRVGVGVKERSGRRGLRDSVRSYMTSSAPIEGKGETTSSVAPLGARRCLYAAVEER